jgi:hypothetical protein
MTSSPVVEDLRNRKLNFTTTQELKQKQDLQKKYTQSWLWRALPCLLEVEGVSHDIRHLAVCLKVSVEDILEATDGLENLGIIRKNGKGWERVLKYIYFSDRDINPMQTLTDHLLVSQQIQNRLVPEGVPSFYRTSFVATSNLLLRDFYLRIEALMAEFIEASGKQSAKNVVGITFSGVNITRGGEI